MEVLEMERGKGRYDYPVRAMWNSILAGVVYQAKDESYYGMGNCVLCVVSVVAKMFRRHTYTQDSLRNYLRRKK